jgi:DNA invertase Pin-like site-specific DNA recombinase
VRFADLPAIEGATGKFLLQQMAAVAELEAGMISARTKAALAAAKRRGKKLGGDRGARLTAKARAAGRAALQAQARTREARKAIACAENAGPTAGGTVSPNTATRDEGRELMEAGLGAH